MAEVEIVDAHCHVASELFTPRSFLRGAAANLHAMQAATGLSVSLDRVVEQIVERMQDHEADELVRLMDAAGISRAVLLVPDFSVALPDCQLTVEEALLRHRAIAARHPGRFHVFAGIDPRHGADGLALLERAICQWGFSGFKVYPPCGFSPSDERLFPFYDLCRAHRVPVLIHMGATSSALAFDTARPELVDRAARTFTDVDFILAHAPVAHTEEALSLCAFRPNVYLDISGFQADVASGRAEAVLQSMLARGINHKILFGTDWPVFERQGTPRDALQHLMRDEGPLADLSTRQAALVLGGNALRLLGRAQRSEA